MFRNPTTDLIVVLVIVLLIFGPKHLPGLGKQLGTGFREFKDSITGDSPDAASGAEQERARPELPRARAAETAAVQAEAAQRAQEPAPERRA